MIQSDLTMKKLIEVKKILSFDAMVQLVLHFLHDRITIRLLVLDA